jgi:hypothetical protein
MRFLISRRRGITMKRSSAVRLGSSLVALALCGPAVRAVGAERERDHGVTATNTCGAVQVSSPDAAATRGRRVRQRTTSSFSASEILDLELRVSLSPALRGDEGVELFVYTPKGHLYQALRANVGGAAGTRDRREVAHRSASARTASATLPVAGTSIVASSLYGEWKVEAHVDGAENACSRPGKFVIEP